MFSIAIAALFTAAPGQVAIAQTDGPTDEERAQAREHFEDGAEYFFEQRYGRALVEFRRAYRLNPHPMIMYNKSLANLRLGNLDDAYDNAAQAAEMTGLPPDEHLRNKARMRGLSVALTAQRVARDVARTEPTPPPDDIADDPDPPRADSGTGTMGWTGIGLSATGLGLLGFAGAINYRLGDKIDAYEQAAQTGDQEQYDALRADIDSSTTTGQIALYSGTGLLLTGAILWLLDRRSDDTPQSQNLSLNPTVSSSPQVGTFIQLNGRF